MKYTILLLSFISSVSVLGGSVPPPPSPWDTGATNSTATHHQSQNMTNPAMQQVRPAPGYATRPQYNRPPGYQAMPAYPPGYGNRPPYPNFGNRPAYPPNPQRGFQQRNNNSPWDRMSRGMPWNNRGGWNNNGGGNNQGWGPDFGEGRIFTNSPDKWFRDQDGVADLWEDMLGAPSRFGEMPGGWSAPSISVPNPVDVGEQFGEASKEVPYFVQDIPDMFDFQY